MKVGIMQPYFLPYIGYWQLIKAVDKYVIYDDVQFIKGGWINRNYTLLNGQKHLINLLLYAASPNKLINEIYVQENQSKLIKTIDATYKKAPMYDKVFPLFVEIMEFRDKNLSSYLGNSIIKIVKYLSIDTEIVYSSGIEKNKDLKSQEKVLHICNLLGADKYINAIGGADLYSKNDFNKAGIELSFLETKIEPYKQFKNEFVPYLSLLDVMMFNDVESINIMINKYNLI